MSSGATAVLVVVVVIIIAAVIAIAVLTRRRRLQEQFGPEYDRAVAEQNSRFRAEAELTDRQRRVRKLDIRPLPEAARAKYTADWVAIQEQFVDSPQAAVADAYALVTTVMTERGYPTDDDSQVLADLSVEHAQTVGHFRAAQEISQNATAGNAPTEDLRQALIHYRALFADLLGDPSRLDPATTATTPATATPPAKAAAAGTDPAVDDGQPDDVVVGTPSSSRSDSDYGGTR
jgi:hypothetical protein